MDGQNKIELRNGKIVSNSSQSQRGKMSGIQQAKQNHLKTSTIMLEKVSKT